MSHYSIISLTPTSDAWIPEYLGAVGPLVAEHGGKYLVRTGSHSSREGDLPGALWVIIEWPGKESEAAFYADPRYVRHLKARLAGSTGGWVSVEGKDDFA